MMRLLRSTATIFLVFGAFAAGCGDDSTPSGDATADAGGDTAGGDTSPDTTTPDPDTTTPDPDTSTPDPDTSTPDPDTSTPDTTEPDTSPADCGNGAIESGELCDGAELGGATCESLGFAAEGTLACAAGCLAYDISGCLPDCGDGTLGDGELCDGTAIVNDLTCADFDYDAGDLGCGANCLSLDTSACTTTAVCGDNTAEGPEACDGTDLGTSGGSAVTCETFGYDAGGTLACTSDCMSWDISGCGANSYGWTCPMAYFNDGECDCGCGVPDPDCGDEGLSACLYCTNPGSCATGLGCGDISPANPAVCVGTVVDCGDGVAGVGEICDGADLRGFSCADFGNFVSGDLGCAAGCTAFDFTDCAGPVIPDEWICDPADYAGGAENGCDCGCGAPDPDCPTSERDACDWCLECSGAGSCAQKVDPDDTTQCLPPIEVPAEWTCNAGFYLDDDCDCGCGAPDIDCASDTDPTQCDYCFACGATSEDDCADFVDPTNTGLCLPTTCGDGNIEGLEQCDGANLNDTACDDIPGFTGGTLACDPVTCQFDTSGCDSLGWTCDLAWYGTGDGCDCGCGVVDPDCTTAEIGDCEFCGACGGGCARVDPIDTTMCLAVPEEWTCDDGYYADQFGDCDCGCGIQDPDCPGTTEVAECDFCEDCPDSGAGGDECSATNVNAADTTMCVAPTEE